MLTLVLGGARSGKSRYAQSLCAGEAAVYVATAATTDDPEMLQRIQRHRRERPETWTTIEEPEAVPSAVLGARPADAPVVVDCVTVWLSNLLWKHRDRPVDDRERAVLQAAAELAAAGRTRRVIAVSNEVGGGTVPDHPVGRTFRDVQGLVNQLLAREAGRVVVVIAGLPMVLKGKRALGRLG